MVRARKQTITSLFCSLQQVLVALWNSADENDFLEMIKEWIYCQDKTLDPYRQILKHILVLCQDLVQVKMRNFSPF